jgi:hypothetical protein
MLITFHLSDEQKPKYYKLNKEFLFLKDVK